MLRGEGKRREIDDDDTIDGDGINEDGEKAACWPYEV